MTRSLFLHLAELFPCLVDAVGSLRTWQGLTLLHCREVGLISSQVAIGAPYRRAAWKRIRAARATGRTGRRGTCALPRDLGTRRIYTVRSLCVQSDRRQGAQDTNQQLTHIDLYPSLTLIIHL